MTRSFSTPLTAILLISLSWFSGPVSASHPMPTDALGRPLYHSSAVAVKLCPEAAYEAAHAKSGTGPFGVQPLDTKAADLGITQAHPMFRTRPTKSRSDLPDLSRIYRVELREGVSPFQVARLLAGQRQVEYAEPIPLTYLAETPDDPDFSVQTFLRHIDCEAAWDVHKGENGAVVVVGVSDSGVQWHHEDLVDNIAQNLGEDADGDGVVIVSSGSTWVFDPDDLNGVDDDGNGYIDDLVGWNMYNDNEQEDNDPDDPRQHGTAVSGLAAGRTDNATGISSVSWNVKLLPCSASNSASETAINRGYECVTYLAENGADIINMSWGGYRSWQVGREVIDYAAGLGSLLVAAAGNEDSSDLLFPAAYPNVVSVASVLSFMQKTDYSNYGISVDLSAPGANLRTTIPQNSYDSLSGTSLSSPIVAGSLALLKSQHPGWSNDQLIRQVQATAESTDNVNPTYVGLLGAGRVNAANMVTAPQSSGPGELRLAVLESELDDDDGNGFLQPGESAWISVSLRNYSHGVSSDAVTFTLTSDNPALTILQPTVTAAVPADETLDLANAFKVSLGQGAAMDLYELTITADAAPVTISPISELTIQLLVADGGILVWEGQADNTYSGRFLADELESRGFDVLYLTGEFPPSLEIFDGVFLSYGNVGEDGSLGARLNTVAQVNAIQQYLEGGGRLYLEGGDTLGYDILDNLIDGKVLLPLFGLEWGEDGTTNDIDSLDGQSGALTDGMRFGSTDQDPVAWIDIFEPSDGTAAFVESGYGIVAVEYAGTYGQRTFCFSYAIADLRDGATTRSQLVDGIIDFFQLNDPEETSPLRHIQGRR